MLNVRFTPRREHRENPPDISQAKEMGSMDHQLHYQDNVNRKSKGEKGQFSKHKCVMKSGKIKKSFFLRLLLIFILPWLIYFLHLLFAPGLRLDRR